MTYLVTARKWRPMLFEDVVGQSHITTTLRNAIATNRLSHAYIFSGPRGVGKTTTARILAKAINCTSPANLNPDNKCELCVEITEGRSVNVFEIDGASNRGVDEIRNLREAVRYGPAKGKYKVYIIDEVHMLTKEAFNALLKTLEEPPSYVLFLFATTEIHKVPSTILSRCQRFDFRRISIDEIIARLRFIASEEHIAIDDDALLIIAKRGDGSLRDAQSIFDQVVSFCGEDVSARQVLSMLNIVDEEIFFRVTGVIKERDMKSGLLLVDEVIRLGYDIPEFINGLTEHIRNLLVVATTKSAALVETSEIYKKRYLDAAGLFSENDLLRLIRIAQDTAAAVKWNQQPRLRLEVALMQMIKLDSSVELSGLLRQLDELKKNFSHPVKTETPLRGDVKASQPVLKTEQVVSAQPQPSSPMQILKSSDPVRKEKEVQPGFISAEDAMLKWSVFVEEARKERIAVGTMLSGTTLMGATDSRICIGCPDDFHLDALNLKRNRMFLQSLAEKVYGAKVQLETILSKNELASSPQQSQETIRPDPAAGHPVIQALIREFGAKEIG